jgi:hypothetical protein
VAIDLGMWSGTVPHTVSVEFLNDAWGGSADTDRNLHVEDILVNGVSTGQTASMLWTGEEQFQVAATATAESARFTFGTGDHVVRLGLSQDVWGDDALYSLFIDGKEVASRMAVSADHAAGAVEYIDLRTDLSGAAPNVTVRFLNDAWGGDASTDRNLRVESLSLDGVDLHQSKVMLMEGDATFRLPTAEGAQNGGQLVRIGLSQDAWGEDARYDVKLDGKVILSNEAVSASRANGEVAYVDIYTDHAATEPGQHVLTVSFLNDAWGGNDWLDRNLHVESLSVNGVDQHQSAFLAWSGDAVFTF